MKTLLRGASIALLSLTAATATLYAADTTGNVSSGTFNLTLNSDFLQTLSKDKIKTTYIMDEAPSSGTGEAFNVEGGIVDLDTGSSEVQSVGGIQFESKTNGTIVQLQRLALESTDTSNAKITALVILNGTYVGRRNVFTVTAGKTYKLPLKYGDVSSGDISFKVTKQFAEEIGDYFPGGPTITGDIGTIALDLVLSPK
jgi:hypothetical protein